MSLDVNLIETIPCAVFEINITHNLTKMANQAGIYKHVWRPEEVGINEAGQLIKPLKQAIKDMEDNPEKYKFYSPVNGWGTYDGFISALKKYLDACERHPGAKVEVFR